MKKIRYQLVIVLVVFNILSAVGQNDTYGVGDWQIHLPYRNCKGVTYAEDRFWAHSESGLFYVDLEFNSVHKFTKIDGLNDVEISYIEYHRPTETLIVAYVSGNIDLIKNDKVTNFDAIKRSTVLGSKTINHVYTEGNLAYLSCDFGLVIFDIENVEIRETVQNISSEGGTFEVYSSTVLDGVDSLVIMTEEGLMATTLLPQYIIQDRKNWITIDGPTEGVNNSIAQLDGSLIVSVNEDGIYRRSDGNWIKENFPVYKKYMPFEELNDGSVVLPADTSILQIRGFGDVVVFNTNNYVMDKVDFGDDGSVFIATYYKGIVSNYTSNFVSYYPDGPLTNEVYKITSMGSDIIVLIGARNRWSGILYGGYQYTYSDFNWTEKIWSRAGLVDVTQFNGKTYFASMGYGALEVDAEGNVEILNELNGAPFVNAIEYNGTGEYPKYLKIADLEHDNQGNLWFANTETRGFPNIHKLTPSGEWSSYLPQSSGSNYPVGIKIDNGGNKWIHVEGPNGLNKIIVYNETSGNERVITTGVNSGNLPDGTIHDYAIDQDDNIWFGTNQGAAVIYDAAQVLNVSNPSAVTPIYEGRPLLQDEVINCIKIDGANRKWFGTKNGVFLFSENGTEAIINFNEDNSPLLSNEIIDIEINESTGEVFFGTDKGIVSYWYDASVGTPTYDVVGNEELMIYPNPVTPDFTGLVGINGLVEYANVKITDISGRIVFEDQANGGMITWDANDMDGQRVATGIYLIFSTNDDGMETFVGKLAVIE